MDKTVDLGVSVNNLHNKLSVMRVECNAKDDLVTKHAKVAEEAIAGWEKAEAETLFLKQELDEALRQRIAAEERIADLDAALKECMQQLHFNQEEQEQRIKNAVMHICREHEQEWALLEEKMGETTKMIAKLDFEKSHLSKSLQAKDKLIEDLRQSKSQVEANFNRLLEKVETEEKTNLRSADASYTQHNDSMKKIVMLEKECQRLRTLLQKRKEPDEFARQTVGLMVKNISSHDNPGKRINFLIEKLCSMEEENRALKESINKKNTEIHILRTMGADTNEIARSTFSHDPSRTSFSESGHEDEISCAESWASALITELEHFTNRKLKDTSSPTTIGASGMDLMDDFVEMEKLATLSMEKSLDSSDTNALPKDTNPQRLQSDVRKSICRIIELIELIDQPSSADYGSSPGYTVRAFQWKTSELHSILQKFVKCCRDLINGKFPMEDFPLELSLALEWTYNHCFSIQDVSRMRDTVKKHLDWDESESESELGNITGSQQKEENTILKQKLANLESLQKDLEAKLQISTEKTEELLIQLRELEEQDHQTKEVLDNETENTKCLRDDVDSELSVVRNELNIASQSSISLELELENKINRCQELETTCIELQLQLDSATKGEVKNYNTEKVGNEQLRSEWEITAASEKLAECQETILNLGKQLKALSSPKSSKSLLDQMVSEDNANLEAYKSPVTKDIPCTTADPVGCSSDVSSQVMSQVSNEISKEKGQAMAIMPSNKCGGVSLLKKLISRRKRESGKQITIVT